MVNGSDHIELEEKGIDPQEAIESEIDKVVDQQDETEGKPIDNSAHVFMRQSEMFDPSKQRYNIKVFGAGSIGSFVTLNLAKLGFNNITCYDFDKVEVHNIPNQFYRYSDIGSFKVNALQSIVKDFSNIDIDIQNIKITPQNAPKLISDIDLNTLVVLSFDNLEARKLVYNVVKEFPIYIMDLRMGGLGYEMHLVDLSDESQRKLYEKSLNKKTVDLPCGMQSISFNILNIASEACNVIVKLNNKVKCPRLVKRHMNNYTFISN